ncbi:MAG: hypothetical protein ACP5HX_08520 [Thermoproteota archaeon]
MKKSLLFLLTLVLVFSATLSLVYNENFPRSVDPSQVKEEGPSPMELLSLYSSIGKFASSLDLNSAINVSTALGKVYVPQNLLYVFQRFNSLLNETLSQMNTTKYYVNLASNNISISDFKGAEKYIYNASKSLALTKVNYNELYDAFPEFSRSTGIYYDKLAEVLNDIETGINELEVSIDNLQNKIESVKPRLMNIFLNVSVKPLNVTYGEEITVTGSLFYENNDTLPFREVVVHIGSKTYFAKTNFFGSYTFRYKVVDYVPRLQIYAEYIPKYSDIGMFTYAKSDTIHVCVAFITPKVNITVYPSKVKPMDNLSIFIKTIPYLKLNVLFFNSTINGYTDSSGLFTLTNLTVPYNVSEGYYNVLVKTFPNGIIGPSGNSSKIVVYKLNPEVRIDFPSITLSGLPLQLKVFTNVTSLFLISSDDINITYVNEGLNVTSDVVVPIGYLGEYIKFSIKLIPKEPWVRNWQTIVQVKVINAPALTILVILSLLLLVNYVKTLRVSSVVEKEKIAPTMPKVTMSLEELPYPARLFYELVNSIKALFGIAIKPSDTIREYLSKLSSSLPEKLFYPLSQILLKYEKAIYGGPEYGKKFIEEVAEDLKEFIKKLRGTKE